MMKELTLDLIRIVLAIGTLIAWTMFALFVAVILLVIVAIAEVIL